MVANSQNFGNVNIKSFFLTFVLLNKRCSDFFYFTTSPFFIDLEPVRRIINRLEVYIKTVAKFEVARNLKICFNCKLRIINYWLL